MAWIDDFDAGWLTWLGERDRAGQANLLLLLDGVFVPGLFDRMRSALTARDDCASVFENLTGYSDEARRITPFVVAFDPKNRPFMGLLRKCEGSPMVSCVQTVETSAQWAARLSRWSVVEIGDAAFNFRYPDTRRLPAIARTLRPAQKLSLLGPATEWHCIDRTGRWSALPIEAQGVAAESEPPGVLDDAQFAALVRDSEPDEMLAALNARSGGESASAQPSRRHAVAAAALLRADAEGVEAMSERLQRVAEALSDPMTETRP